MEISVKWAVLTAPGEARGGTAGGAPRNVLLRSAVEKIMI